MLVVLFLIILYNVVVTLMGKVDRSKTYCGMVGYCGGVAADPMLLRILLMYNNSRGGDSTGWAVNNKITKDLGKVEEFLTKNNLTISESDHTYTFIAHARKASSGLRMSRDHAHPFGIYKDGVESDKFDLVLAMNGTLNNETAFADHFGFDWDRLKHSDTEMMAKVMAKLGPKDFTQVLEGYGGYATLLFYSPRNKNVLMVYKDPMRPLFYWQKTPDQIYISSLKESFLSFGVPEADVIEFDGDHLYKIVKGEIKLKTKIERSPLFKAVVPPRSYPGGVYKGGAANNNRSCDLDYNNYYNLDINKLNKTGDRLCLLYDKYYRNHHGATGTFYLNDEGDILSLKSGETYATYPMFKPHFFIAGYKMKDEQAFKSFGQKVCLENGEIDWPKMQSVKTSELLGYVDYPIMIIGVKPDKHKYWIVPTNMQTEMEAQGTDQFSHVHFLSEYKITLVSAKTRIKNSDILCFELKSYSVIPKPRIIQVGSGEKIDRKSIIKDAFNDGDVENFILDSIKEDPSITPKDLFDQSRIYLFKMNGSDELKEYFYNDVLIDMAFNMGLLDTNEHNEMQRLNNGKNSWDGHYMQGELNRLLRKLVAHQKATEELKEAPQGEVKDIKDISELSAIKRIQVSQFDHSQFSAADAIKELRDSNTYLSIDMFNSSMMAPSKEKYDEFVFMFIQNYAAVTEDTINFAIAVALKLKELEDITARKLLDILKHNNQDLINEVKYLYEQYCRRVIDELIMDKENPEEKSWHDTLGSEDHQLDNKDEDVEDGQFTEDTEETFSADDCEKEMEDMLGAIMEQTEMFLKDLQIITEPHRTERINEIQKQVGEVHKYLNKHLFQDTYEYMEIND